MSEWPKRYAKMQARRALAALPERVRPFYHPEYKIALYSSDADRDGDFAGLVCNECNRWREYGHDEGCPVRRYEPGYRWRPKIVRAHSRYRHRRATPCGSSERCGMTDQPKGWEPSPQDLARLSLVAQWFRCDQDDLRRAIERQSIMELDNLGIVVRGACDSPSALLEVVYAEHA